MKTDSFKKYAILAFLLSGCSGQGPFETPVKFTFGSLNEDEMPIVGYVAPMDSLGLNTLEQYRAVHDAGINTVIPLEGNNASGTKESVYKALEYAEQCDVNYLVKDSALLDKDGNDFKTAYESRDYEKYASFAGFSYQDEPVNADFPAIQKAKNKFDEYVGNDYLFYVNLLPVDSFDNAYHTDSDYTDYVVNYLDSMINPRFISYDFYALNDEFPHLKENYFRNLNVISKVALENNVSFWNFVLATEHTVPDQGFVYRNPSETEMNWQVNTSLAYGSKGIEYFCYQQPVGDSDAYGRYSDYGGSFIDTEGNKQDMYYYGQRINTYIQKIDHILMNSNRKAMIAHETGKVSASLYGDFVDSYGNIKELITEGDVLVSAFAYKRSEVYYVVNFSLEEEATFTLSLNRKAKYRLYEKEKDSAVNAKSITLSLQPGEAVLLEKI